MALRPFHHGGADLKAPLTVSVAGQPMTIVSLRRMAQDFLVRFDGIQDRDQAAALTNREVAVERDLLPQLDDEEVYVDDLLGCAVEDPRGHVLGVVKATFWNGAQDVLSVVDEAGNERLFPAVPDFIVDIDLQAKRLVVDPHE